MNLNNILSLIGGLALFLFGMETMGMALRKASGGKLESALERLTRNRIMALLLGIGVTAVIQSSSATTVMVVGFVNSGIMKLAQAVNVIMGANIGTTITAWILSLTGIESDNFFVRLLKPDTFTPVLALIGIAMILGSKKERRKNIGSILIGFSILMFGMGQMSTAMKPLASEPDFINLFTLFSHPILGLLMGAVLTAVIQSSSASVGILQALSLSGAMPFSAALPIIMGQNIGTCVTALLSSIGTSKNARRASIIHLLFNFIGTVIFMIIFYTLHGILDFAFMQKQAEPFGIALLHTAFNIFTSIILFPFSQQLVSLSKFLIKDEKGQTGEENPTLRLLDPRFMTRPSFALLQAHEVMKRMCAETEHGLKLAFSLMHEFDETKFERVAEIEGEIDRYEDAVGTYLIQLSKLNLSEKDSNLLNLLIKGINDIERISDHALNIAFLSKSKKDANLQFSEQAIQELEIYEKAATTVLLTTRQVFDQLDAEKALNVEPLEQVIDGLNKELHRRHIKRLQSGRCTIGIGLIFMDFLADVERISDHCSNIAVDIISLMESDFDTHQHQKMLRQEQNFEARVQIAAQKFQLPPEVKSSELSPEQKEELDTLSSALSRDKGKKHDLYQH